MITLKCPLFRVGVYQCWWMEENVPCQLRVRLSTLEYRIVNSSLETIGTTACTVEAAAGGAAQVLNSRLIASGTNPPIGAVGAATIMVAGTLLSGGAPFLGTGGAVTCAGVYDENFVFSASSCP